MLNTFKGLKPFQLSEFILLISFAFIIPSSWMIATYIMIALFVTTILRGVFEEGFKINQLQYKNKLTYFIFIAFWVTFAISFLYSDNSAEARFQIGKKLPFFLFPLYFLCSNLSYLTKDRIRTIMYFFIFGIFTLILINLIWATYDVIFEGEEIKRLTSPHEFFKTNNNDAILNYIHRAFFSIYSCLALAFCSAELFTNKKLKIFNIISIIILTFIPFYMTSRAGMLCTALVLFLVWIWITFILKRKKMGIITCGLMAIFLITGYFAFPQSIDRYTEALNNIKDGKGDVRLTLRKASKEAVSNNLIFGVGVGDKNDETMQSFQNYKDDMISKIKPFNESDLNIDNNKNIFADSICKYEHKYVESAYKYADSIIDADEYDDSPIIEYLSEYKIVRHCMRYELNTHNQFSDIIIAVGLPGLILFLMMFACPIYLWIKNRNFDITFFSLLFIIAFNSLFESVLERQMGIMFFVFFYFILFHNNFCQQKTKN